MAQAKLTPEQWAEIRVQYEQGVSNMELARRFPISRQAIIDAAKKHHWIRGDIEREADRVVKAKMEAIAPEQKAAMVERIADARLDLIVEHQAAWRDVYEFRKEARRIMAGDKPEIIKDLDLKAMGIEKRVTLALRLISAFDREASALMTAQEGQRRAFGFDYRSQQAGDARDESEERRRTQLTGSIIDLVAMLKARTDPRTIEGEVVR